MLPFEFTIPGPPVSSQTRNRARLHAWRNEVRLAAQAKVPPGALLEGGPVKISITYYYEGDTPDVDNIIKPIQDAVIGVVFHDDDQVEETKSWKRALDGSYQIKGASAVLLQAFSQGVQFLHIRIEACPHIEALDR
jgi:hypothetical protein